MYKFKYLIILTLVFLGFFFQLKAEKILIPMDLAQTDHLKSYGLAYWTLKKEQTVDWLLNYRGGSFITDYNNLIANECRIRGVFFEVIDETRASQIYSEVQQDNVNMDVVKLEKAPKIAVYVTPGVQPWDDAVRLALEYAEIEYDVLWDEEVLSGKLDKYDWLHLHHEDFTGQFGKFWMSYQNVPWYIEQVSINQAMAKKLGFNKVSEMKKAVVHKIKEYIGNGGFIFAMCSASDSFDITLAATNIDICESMFDGDPADPNANNKLDYSQTLAFENFKLEMSPYVYEFSNIDIEPDDYKHRPEIDYFTLFDFSAKYDPVPTMLTQSHANIIQGFMGQTSAFRKEIIKKSVTILAEREGTDEVRYIHGNYGKGTFTWFSGHDPEDYKHMVGEKPTEMTLCKNSPGYRLILNNVLFPAAKKKKQKT